jgi:hypothetical protein
MSQQNHLSSASSLSHYLSVVTFVFPLRFGAVKFLDDDLVQTLIFSSKICFRIFLLFTIIAT